MIVMTDTYLYNNCIINTEIYSLTEITFESDTKMSKYSIRY